MTWEQFWKAIADWLKGMFYPMGLEGSVPVKDKAFVDILLAVLLCVAVFFLFKWLWEGFFWPGFKAIGHGVNVMFHSAKHRCSKITCKHCGRTLDKCVCENNKNASYNQRLRRYYKELRAARKAAKEAAKKD
jgi:hypothetical protein